MADKIESMIKKTILREMISAAHAANMPKSFIENIKLHKIDETTFEIRNEWTGPKDEPLAVFFEYGTKDHWIGGNPLLAWMSKGPQSGHAKAIFSKRADNKKGNMLFSKGHYVTGLFPYEPMTNGFRKGSQLMAEEIKSGR